MLQLPLLERLDVSSNQIEAWPHLPGLEIGRERVSWTRHVAQETGVRGGPPPASLLWQLFRASVCVFV